MSVQKRGEKWTVEVVDDTIIWEFLPGMELDVFREEAFEIYEELLGTHNIRAMVTVVDLDDPFDAETFKIWERSARKADTAGVNRWAVVAEGITAISLQGKIDTGDLETKTTENRTEAVEWAQEA